MILYRTGQTEEALEDILKNEDLSAEQALLRVLDWLGDPVQVEQVDFVLQGSGPHQEFVEVHDMDGAGVGLGEYVLLEGTGFHAIRFWAVTESL